MRVVPRWFCCSLLLCHPCGSDVRPSSFCSLRIFQAQHAAPPISAWQQVSICSQAHLAYCTQTVFPHTNLRLELATLFPSQSLFVLGNLTNFRDIWQDHIAGILLPQRPMLIILLSCSKSARMSIICMVRCSSIIIGAWLMFSRGSGALTPPL